MAHARLILIAVLAAGFGCGASRSERPPPAAAPPAAAPTPRSEPRSAPSPGGLEDRDWGECSSVRFSLVLPLPERSSWRVDDQAQRWLVAAHPGTDSVLLARTWRAARLVTPDDCEKQARLWRPTIPRPTPESVLESRKLEAPAGYTTQLVVGVHPAGGDTLEGFTLAFGATVGRCLALVYTTQAAGSGAEIAIGHRLRLMADGVLSRVTTRSVDDRGRGERIER